MVTVLQTSKFSSYLKELKDRNGKAQIMKRLNRIRDYGHFGDFKPIGDGVSELRINYGPGYRVYFVRHGELAVILLCGGDKSSQDRDIETAKRLVKEIDYGTDKPIRSG